MTYLQSDHRTSKLFEHVLWIHVIHDFNSLVQTISSVLNYFFKY